MRIVVRSQDAQRARDTQARLLAAGIEASAILGAAPAPNGEDLSIVTSAQEAPAIARSALGAVAALSAATPPPPGLSSPHGYLGAIAIDAPPKMLAAQMNALIRVAIGEEERARRALTAETLGFTPPTPLEARKLKALYIGAPSPVFLSFERALSEHSGLIAAAFSSFAGFDHLHDEAFDAVVLNGAQDSATAISLCAALRRNASLHHLPTMVITAPGDTATANAAIDRGASAITTATAPGGPSLGWLFEAIRASRRRRSAEHEIRALRDIMGDTRTGLFQRAPFDAHLARLAADHHASGRSMSLAVLRILPAHGAREPTEAMWKRAFTEVTSLAGRLMRETDSGAVIGGDAIAIALPSARLKAARRTAERIASVGECTAFASGEAGMAPLIFEQSAVELQPGESGAGLLARALRALEIESIPA